jgi:hypothetical protein
MKQQESAPASMHSPVADENQRALILLQLKRIQDSHAFCNSARAKEFLSYVIGRAVEGQAELLKERSIGVDLFHRNPTYLTGEDPIVRVKAAEVRKRLAQFYAQEDPTPEVRIEIPVGSYVPKFSWRSPAELARPHSETPASEPKVQARRPHAQKIAISAFIFVLLGIAIASVTRKPAGQQSTLETFWAPVFTSQQQVLICIASPVAYEFSADVYRKAGQADQGPHRDNTPLQLPPETALKWKDTVAVPDFFVNKDDTYVAADLAGLFAGIHKSSAVRVGRDYTYEDLRNSPAVLIGAYNNPLAMQMISDLPIVFREKDGLQWIEERASPGRVWRAGVDGRRGSKDFAVVARLLNSKTGQFLVIVAGIGMVGTEAAGRFISRTGDIDAALRTAPAGWQRKNLEVVLETDVIDGSPASPRVVAVTVW